MRPASEWTLSSDYRAFARFVRFAAVDNTIAERGCHMITEFANRVQDEEVRSALCLTVAHHRQMVTGFTKNSLELC